MITGITTGKAKPPSAFVNSSVSPDIPAIAIAKRTVPEVMFPKRRNASDTTFAATPIMSRSHKKREITISAVFIGIRKI